MKLINQHSKAIMEKCKYRAREAGLSFNNETLEYIISNKDMIELYPKLMIPTLYDYWVNDIEILKEQAKYKLYPKNPHETVINSRPPISFYNENNPDWLNIMIFYHVLAHIDFFQNNLLFSNTWNDDFVGQALADKRLISKLRGEKGRWVDYVIEFSRSINNLVNCFDQIVKSSNMNQIKLSGKLNYYFNSFLLEKISLNNNLFYKEIERYNKYFDQYKNLAESIFLSEINSKYSTFQNEFEKYENKQSNLKNVNVMNFILNNSPLLKKKENQWIKSIINIVRNTASYFSPQIRTKIINEGWASYWHDKLFLQDDRISGHEIQYAKINSWVTSVNNVGLNPYAIGLRLFEYVEELANKGKLNFEFQKMQNINQRENYNKNTGLGKSVIFNLREYFSDFMLINTFVDQDFINKYNLFVVGRRLNKTQNEYEFYVKSKKVNDYKNMLLNSLYHPPNITVNIQKTNDQNLYLIHNFEGSPLLKEFISDTLIGIEYLWGSEVYLETTEVVNSKYKSNKNYIPVIYTSKNRCVQKRNL